MKIQKLNESLNMNPKLVQLAEEAGYYFNSQGYLMNDDGFVMTETKKPLPIFYWQVEGIMGTDVNCEVTYKIIFESVLESIKTGRWVVLPKHEYVTDTNVQNYCRRYCRDVDPASVSGDDASVPAALTAYMGEEDYNALFDEDKVFDVLSKYGFVDYYKTEMKPNCREAVQNLTSHGPVFTEAMLWGYFTNYYPRKRDFIDCLVKNNLINWVEEFLREYYNKSIGIAMVEQMYNATRYKFVG